MQRRSGLSARATASRFRWCWWLLFVPLIFLLAGCTPTSGIFASSTWQVGGLQNEHLQVLAVDPNHLTDFYAGDVQDGVFVSTDSGATWKNSSAGLPQPITVYALSYDSPGKKLYAATSAGLFVSLNAAQNWNAVAGLPSGACTALTFDGNTSQIIYVGTAYSGVWKSSDGGTSWTAINAGLPSNKQVTSILSDPNLRQLWVSFVNALYRSDDGGTNWRTLDTGLPANAGINVIASGNVTSGSLLFVGTDHGLLLSTDDGQHWAQSQSSLSDLHVQDILADVTQDNVIYVSTDIGVLRSQDNGQSWQQVATGLPANQPIDGLVEGGNDYGQLLVASGGVYIYPGNSSVFDPSRLIPLLIILLFFVFLYRFFLVGRRRNRQRVEEASESANKDTDG